MKIVVSLSLCVTGRQQSEDSDKCFWKSEWTDKHALLCAVTAVLENIQRGKQNHKLYSSQVQQRARPGRISDSPSVMLSHHHRRSGDKRPSNSLENLAVIDGSRVERMSGLGKEAWSFEGRSL